MNLLRFRSIGIGCALVLGFGGLAASTSHPAGASTAAASTAAANTAHANTARPSTTRVTTADANTAAGQTGAGDCIAHHPAESAEYHVYTGSCTGHDEPELDPVSSAPGSGQDLTWTAVLPKDGAVPVSAVGPTFWWGGTVTDPNPQALFGQAFLEVQFYPDAIVNTCSTDGGFNVTFAPDKFTVCSPTWQVTTTGNKENAAFNAELHNGSTKQPLVMTGGDTIKIHFFIGAPGQGWNVQVTDLTTGQQGTIVLNSKYGPLLPAFSTQQIGNSLGWGLVNDTPNSFVWEIGHTSNFTTPAGQFCTPGQTSCDSYDTAHWLGFTPLQIKSVQFADGSGPSQWATVSDLGGNAEVNATCTTTGGPFCSYPWFALNQPGNAFTFGADYPGTAADYGQSAQYTTTMQCGGQEGANTTFCDTLLSPTPPVG